MSPPLSVLVTGANRGIGLGLVKQLLTIPTVKHVIAGARNPDAATDLNAISDPRLAILKLDIEDDQSIQSAADQVSHIVGDSGLNLLLNNAGVFVPYWTDRTISRAQINHSFNVNTTGVAIISQTFLPLLKKASSTVGGDSFGAHRAALVNISSMWGSIARNQDGSGERGALAYKMSKAALNQFGKTLSIDLKKDGIVVAQFCPGWVQTDMGGQGAAITTEESATALVDSITKLSEEHSGLFFDRNLKKMDF